MSWVVSSSGSGMFNLPLADAPAWQNTLEQLCEQPELLKHWGAEGRRALHERFSMTGCALSLASEYFISQNESCPCADQSSILANWSTLLSQRVGGIFLSSTTRAATIPETSPAALALQWHDPSFG
jgi:hypothetical protein